MLFLSNSRATPYFKNEYCIFLIWTPHGFTSEKIERDTAFWECHMVERLKSFYLNHLLPEILKLEKSRK